VSDRSSFPDSSASASDGLVRVLPDVLASKIAAGEVVQRPASVAKELIENALDAGATEVQLLLKKAGSELVQVVDDGCGMGPADALACFGRHATSKLRAIEDLERLATLGFRGEALASIAAVAQVELRTRRVQDEVGTRVRIDGGALVEQAPCATPPGTSIAVRNLFYNVPARRHFLKTPATEFKHLVETFQTQALSCPAAGFTLVHDEFDVYRLPASDPASDAPFEAALRHRIADLFGDKDPARLVPVEETTSYLTVRGFVGRPDEARRSRGEQFVFVNGRYVKSRTLDHAVATAFGALLPEGRHPFFVLFLDVDPRHVDVNVHPTKTEIKFDDERGVYGFLKAVVKKGLAAADLALAFGPATPASAVGLAARLPDEPTVASAASAPRSFSFTGAAPPAGDGSARPPAAWPSPSEGFPEAEAADVRAGSEPSEPSPAPGAPLRASGGHVRFPSRAAMPEEADDAPVGERTIWQLHHRYILTPLASGLLVLDQQAAHERVLYERALTAMEGGMGASQQLLFPHTFAFDPADFELLKELLPDLRSLGFELEVLSGRSVLVRGVPSEVRSGDDRTVLDDLLAQYRANRDGFHLEGRENLARSLARRNAYKPGQVIRPEEARVLIDQLFACEMPYVDPAGRPTVVKISMEELDRRFSRSVR